MHSGNQPFPEVCWLGVGVIHAECAHTMFDPVLHHAENFLVDALLIVVEVQGVNVLVFLRWVFCIGNRAVRQHGEPFGVLCGPGVIRRALQRQVQGHLKTQLLGLGHQGVEILNGAQLRVYRIVATGF